jgi:hypothetical protein
MESEFILTVKGCPVNINLHIYIYIYIYKQELKHELKAQKCNNFWIVYTLFFYHKRVS